MSAFKSTPSLVQKKSQIGKKKSRKDTISESISEIPDEDAEPNYNLPGVLTITLKPKTQKQIQLIVGDDVTSEKPWKNVKKTTLLEHIHNYEASDFKVIKENIENYPDDEMLLGYRTNEQSLIDEFYVCTTPEVKNTVYQLWKSRAERLRKNLVDKCIKYPRSWRTLKSETEVAEMQEDQRYRALFEVEIESRFPVVGEKTQFRNRNTDDVRDGCVEIIPYRESFDNVKKLRIDASAQITPAKKAVSVQTICTFPTNQWTQYGYEYEAPIELPIIVKKGQPKPKTPLEKFLQSEVVAPIYDEMVYNSVINLYKDDYPDLCKDDSYLTAIKHVELTEFMSFADVIKCQDKFIGACSWHHFWSGIVALSYVDVAVSSVLRTPLAGDAVYRAIHGVNPVLLWSAAETLNPILELYTPREVHTLEFCPFDENLIIGGLMNGQVILWDLKNCVKFHKPTEILTGAQQKYKTIMKQTTTWFKNIKSDVVVRPACISNLYLSHRRRVCTVKWLPPYQRINRAGKSIPIENAGTHPSYQFLSGDEDGSIYIWDLTLEDESREVKTDRISKRLHSRLDELNVDKSAFSVLNNLLKPLFKLNMPKTGIVSEPITCVTSPLYNIHYENVSQTKYTEFKTQIVYKPKIPTKVKPFQQKLFVAFASNDMGIATWDGYDVDAGSPINMDTCNLKLFRKLHDGTILGILPSPFMDDIILSYGGNIVSIWQTDFLQEPIFTQGQSKLITCCTWSLFRPSCFFIGLADGTVHVYDIMSRADKSTLSQSISGKGLTIIKCHKIEISTNNVLGVGDYRGTFRLFTIPNIFSNCTDESLTLVKDLLAAAISRRKDFIMWQDQWLDRHKDELNAIEEKEQRIKEEKKRQMDEEIRLAEQQEQKRIDDERKRILLESHPQPGQYEQWAQKKYDKMQAIHMHNILLQKKRLKREDLITFLAPLNRIEEEKKKKAVRQEKMLQKKGKLFQDELAISFPETQEQQVGKQKQLISYDEIDDMKCLHMYANCEEESLSLIKSKPYTVEFTWTNLIHKGLERKRIIDIGLKLNMKHRERIKNPEPKPLEPIQEIPPSVKPATQVKDGSAETLMEPTSQDNSTSTLAEEESDN